jgi:hypothetical protein
MAVTHPEDGRLTSEQVAAFRAAWEAIDSAVPAGG